MKLDAKEITDAILQIAQARADGRAIVPLVGAGMSAESGAPTISGLIRYFAYLQAYVTKKAYLPKKSRTQTEHPLVKRAEKYKDSLRTYIDDFDWPSPNDLIDGLWRWDLDEEAKEEKWDLDEEAVRQLDLFAKKIHPGRFQALPENGQVAGWSWRWSAVAEWTDLVRHVTEFSSDLATRLFTRLQRGRRPALGHRCLAFLARLCSIRLFLSVSISDLVEQALWDEGVSHRLYLLGDRPLPDPVLVRNSVAVLKLFGDASQPVLGEQYETPVDSIFLDRLRDVLPGPRPLLLVLGFRGRGRRIMDLVERAFLKPHKNEVPKQPDVIWLHYEKDRPQTVLDLQETYSGQLLAACVNSPGLFLRHLYSSLTSRHHAATEPYDALERRPTPLTFEPPLVENPPGGDGITEYRNDDSGSLVVFHNLRPVKDTDSDQGKVVPTASERLAEWMNEQEDFIPIWVDLEGQYTLPGVVGAIIDQCRLHDPEIAPSVLPLDEMDEAPKRFEQQIKTAARRLGEALQRGRYAVALDGLEMLPWPQTSHHGITSGENEVPRTKRLLDGFIKLIEKVSNAKDSKALKSSRLAVSVNWPSGRHNPKLEGELETILQQCLGKPQEKGKEIKGLLGLCNLRPTRTFLDPLPGNSAIKWKRQEGEVWVHASDKIRNFPGLPGKGVIETHGHLVLFIVSCFRRTRSLVALRSILGPLPLGGKARGELGPYANVDDLLLAFVDEGYFIPLEGGLYWMKRPVRDRIYSENSSATTTEKVCKAFKKPEEIKKEDLHLMLQQLVLLALHHDRIARHYYAETFAQSKDPLAFFEYVYHRVSSIRYLTKLELVLEAVWRGHDENAVVDETKVPKCIGEVCQALIRLLPKGRDYLQCGRDTDDWLAKGVDLRHQVKSRRLQEIKSLRVAWEAAADTLQTCVPAEHLISWCRWLLKDDLPRFCTAYYARRGNASEPWRAICMSLDDPLRDSWRDLRDELHSLWANCCRERGDPRGLILQCKEYYRSLEDELNLASIGPPYPPVAACAAILDAGIKVSEAENPDKVSQTIKWTELLQAGLAPSQDQGWPILPKPFHRELRTGLLDLAEGLLWLGERGLLDAVTAYVKNKEKGKSASLRCAELQAEAEYRDQQWGRFRDVAEAGLLEARQIDFIERHTADRFPYFRYWSHFLQYRARAHWNLPSDDPTAPEKNFKLAYRDLEMARGRSEMNPSRTAQARIDLVAAECALEHARWFLGKSQEPKGANKAAAKMDVADSYLRRALDHLQHGRRNVIWWREYFRLRAVYKVRRNACRLAQLGALEDIPRDETSLNEWGQKEKAVWAKIEPKIRPFVKTLRQGLIAVGQVVDLTLDLDDGKRIVDERDKLVKDAWRMGALALANQGSGFLGELAGAERMECFNRGLKAIDEYVKDLAVRSDALVGAWPAIPIVGA